MSLRKTLLGMTAALGLATAAAGTAAQAQPIPIGHLMDLSGATSDVGTPFAQGVNDTYA